MPELIESWEARPYVIYSTLDIGPMMECDPDPSGDVVNVIGSGLRLNSSNNDFYPVVRFEMWESNPPAQDDGWDFTAEFTALFQDQLTVVNLEGMDDGTRSVTPGRRHVRLSCRGRDTPPAVEVLSPFPPHAPHEEVLELWRVQIWPVL
ncbi:hypothetical protein [Streptomyces microflavus]|uniref:hypothetical protein n=1 Tax=Streptomyces microflavus TaxID=1919 RepID=UPI0033B2FAAE